MLGGNAEFMARLKLRELLMPQIVSQVEAGNPYNGGNGAPKVYRLECPRPDMN